MDVLCPGYKSLGESVELAEKWAHHFDKYYFTSVKNDIQLVHSYLFHTSLLVSGSSLPL